MNEDQIKQYGLRVAERVRDECGDLAHKYVAAERFIRSAMNLPAVVASVAVPQEQSAQKPVAWQYRAKTKSGNVETDWHNCYENEAIRYRSNPDDGILIYEVRDLYSAPPVPRDVLMALAYEVRKTMIEVAYNSQTPHGTITRDMASVDLAAIADRYASKVQPVCQTCKGSGYIGDFLTLAHDHMKEQQPSSAQPVAVPDEWHEAATVALRFIEANAGHDQLCGVFDLDDEGRHKTCTCGMEDATQKLRAMLSAAQKPEGGE